MMQKIQGGGDLPPEYQRVEFLESSGAQFIELDFGFNPNDEIILKGRLKQTGNDKFIVSPRVWNNDNNRFALYGYYTDLTCTFGMGDSLLMILAPKINWGSEYSIVSRTFEYRDHMFMCDGSSADGSAHTFGSDTANLRLFYGYDSPTSAAIYSYIHLKNGIKVCELIPCYRISDGKSGMYDTITGEFKTNLGSGELIPGPTTDRWGAWLDNYSWDGWFQIFEKANGWYCSTPLPVTEGDVIKCENSGGLGNNLYFFDGRMNVVDKIVSNWGGTYTTPTGAKYAAWSTADTYHKMYNLTTGESI